MTIASYHDDPLRRLSWIVPVAMAVTLLSFAGFRNLLAMPALPPPPPPIDVQVMEIPPPAPPQAEPAPLPPPVPEPEALPQKQETAAPKPKPIPHLPTPQKPVQQTRQLPTALPVPIQPAAPPTSNMGARALFQPPPEIPDALRHRTIDLVALAHFNVAADGSATVELTQATSEPTLNRAVLDALRQWRFFPAVENGRPVSSTLDIRIPITVHP